MGPVLWLFALLPLAFCLQPDGYCNPPYPSWRAQPDYPLKHLTGRKYLTVPHFLQSLFAMETVLLFISAGQILLTGLAP